MLFEPAPVFMYCNVRQSEMGWADFHLRLLNGSGHRYRWQVLANGPFLFGCLWASLAFPSSLGVFWAKIRSFGYRFLSLIEGKATPFSHMQQAQDTGRQDRPAPRPPARPERKSVPAGTTQALGRVRYFPVLLGLT